MKKTIKSLTIMKTITKNDDNDKKNNDNKNIMKENENNS